MSVTGPEGGEPTKAGVALVDVLAGLHALAGILAALAHRDRTGEGQRVETNLLAVLLSSLVNQASGYLGAGVVPTPMGNRHPSICPYQTFATADRPIALAVGNDKQFTALMAALGAPETAQDARFISNAQRVANRDELCALLDRLLVREGADHWYRVLNNAGVPAGPINDIAEAFDFARRLGLQPSRAGPRQHHRPGRQPNLVIGDSGHLPAGTATVGRPGNHRSGSLINLLRRERRRLVGHTRRNVGDVGHHVGPGEQMGSSVMHRSMVLAAYSGFTVGSAAPPGQHLRELTGRAPKSATASTCSATAAAAPPWTTPSPPPPGSSRPAPSPYWDNPRRRSESGRWRRRNPPPHCAGSRRWRVVNRVDRHGSARKLRPQRVGEGPADETQAGRSIGSAGEDHLHIGARFRRSGGHNDRPAQRYPQSRMRFQRREELPVQSWDRC